MSALDITIRCARAGEAEALTEIAIQSKKSNGYDDDFMARCCDELTISEQYLRQVQVFVAADSADVALGFVVLAVSDADRTGEICDFFIRPEQKRRGVGKALWRSLKEAAGAQQLEELHLDADPHAVAFYEAMGFEVVSEVPSGSIEGRSLPHMVQKLG